MLFSRVQIWNHPWVLKLDEVRKKEREERKELDEMLNDEESGGSLEGFIVDDSDDSLLSSKETSRSSRSSSVSSDSVVIVDSPSTAKERDKSRSSSVVQSDGQPSPKETWYSDVLADDCAWKCEVSGKVTFLMELLREVERVREKLLVFSQSLLILDYLEELIKRPENGNWAEGVEYLRIDGSTKADNRASFMKQFNKQSNERSDSSSSSSLFFSNLDMCIHVYNRISVLNCSLTRPYTEQHCCQQLLWVTMLPVIRPSVYSRATVVGSTLLHSYLHVCVYHSTRGNCCR